VGAVNVGEALARRAAATFAAVCAVNVGEALARRAAATFAAVCAVNVGEALARRAAATFTAVCAVNVGEALARRAAATFAAPPRDSLLQCAVGVCAVRGRAVIRPRDAQLAREQQPPLDYPAGQKSSCGCDSLRWSSTLTESMRKATSSSESLRKPPGVASGMRTASRGRSVVTSSPSLIVI
jgi:hypothetical protein